MTPNLDFDGCEDIAVDHVLSGTGRAHVLLHRVGVFERDECQRSCVCGMLIGVAMCV